MSKSKKNIKEKKFEETRSRNRKKKSSNLSNNGVE